MKEFDLWNEETKLLENRSSLSSLSCKKGQIWLCKIGENIGSEISKKSPFVRPVYILHPAWGGDLVLCVPISKKCNSNLYHFYHKISYKYGLQQDSYLVLNQIKPISKKRLLKKLNDTDDIPRTTKNEYEEILIKIQNLIKK